MNGTISALSCGKFDRKYSVCNIRFLDRGKNFKRRSLTKLKMSVTVIYRFLNWIAPCKVCWLVQFCSSLFQWPWKQRLKERFESTSIKITWFFHISYHHISSCSLQSRLCTFQSFFFLFLLGKPLLPATEKCTLKWGAWKIASRGINAVSLVRHFSQTRAVTCPSFYIFRNSHW